MNHSDEAAVANEEFWEQEVARGGGHTLPWVDLDVEELRKYIRGDLNGRIVGRRDPERFVNMVPDELRPLGNVEGKDLLCLGCGGGQQSALFALLGARVTVVDISNGQLEADRRAASHYGYDVRTIHADMRDLSFIEAESMDVVIGWSTAYVPDVVRVHLEVARVMKVGGLYSTGANQPATGPVEWDGSHYRLTKPYADRNENPEESNGTHCFIHYMDDMFNGLADAGLSIERVVDPHRHRRPGADTKPGGYLHEIAYVGGYYLVFARKLVS